MVVYLKKYIQKYIWWYIAGGVFIIARTIVASLSPKYVQEAIDYLSDDFNESVLFQYLAIIITIAVVQGLFQFLMRRIMIGASRLIENDFRNEFFHKLSSLDMHFYHHNRTGDLMARATNDLGNIRSVFGPAVMYTINLTFSFIVYLYMMIEISPKLTFWATLPIPVMAVVVYYFGQIIHKKQSKIQAQYSEISNYAQENLAGSRVVKSFGLENDQINHFSFISHDYFKKFVSFMKIQSLFHPSIYVIISFGTAAIFYVGGHLVIQDIITIGEFTAFILYLGMLTWPSIAVGWVAGLYQTGASSMNRINKILNEESTVQTPKPKPLTSVLGHIEFKNLTFTYPNAQSPVLHNIELTIKPGETLGIIGAVGSGKTTLVSLINRLYQVEDGQLFIDGTDINTLKPEELSQFVSVVPQETFLFSQTIKENITFGYKGTDSEIEKAVEDSHLKETLNEFPDGLDTLLGERGVNLSGGQKQRVAIARALIRQTPITIFDDSLSAVDTHTEEQILNALIKDRQDKTTLLISHRISTLKHADNIICLENGRIIEQGTHDALVQLGGEYARLYEKQLLEEELNTLG